MVEEQQSREKLVLICCSTDEAVDRITDVLSDCRIERFNSGDSLLKAIGSEPVDLVLTGRQASAKESIELLRQIRSMCKATRVILRPRDSTRDDVIAAIRGRAFSYFSKPFFEAAFGEILRHAISGSPWEDYVEVSSATPAWLRLVARCEMATADRVIQFMNEMSDLGDKERESMGFALKEILMNAMEYGGKVQSGAPRRGFLCSRTADDSLSHS